VNDTSSQLKHDNNTDIARFDHFGTRILLFYGVFAATFSS